MVTERGRARRSTGIGGHDEEQARPAALRPRSAAARASLPTGAGGRRAATPRR